MKIERFSSGGGAMGVFDLGDTSLDTSLDVKDDVSGITLNETLLTSRFAMGGVVRVCPDGGVFSPVSSANPVSVWGFCAFAVKFIWAKRVRSVESSSAIITSLKVVVVSWLLVFTHLRSAILFNLGLGYCFFDSLLLVFCTLGFQVPHKIVIAR